MISNDRTLASQDDVIDLVALWRMLWSYRYVVASTTILCGLVAVVLALTATPIFRAEVVVTEVRDQKAGGIGALAGQLGGLASLAGVNLSTGGETQESRAVLQSRRVAEEFIKRYNLTSELFPDADEPPTLWRTVRQFREGVLTIREDSRKGTTTIAVNWTDPKTAARWANDFVALVNEMLRDRAISESKRSVEYLNDQIAHTKVVELQRVMYNLIETETKTLMLANARAEYAFAVVDPAVAPEIKIKPRRTFIVIIGVIIGFLIGAIFAVSRHAVSRSTRDAASAA